MNHRLEGQPHGSTMPEPDLVELERFLSGFPTLRVTVNTLHQNLPAELETDSLYRALREPRGELADPGWLATADRGLPGR